MPPMRAWTVSNSYMEYLQTSRAQLRERFENLKTLIGDYMECIAFVPMPPEWVDTAEEEELSTKIHFAINGYGEEKK